MTVDAMVPIRPKKAKMKPRSWIPALAITEKVPEIPLMMRGGKDILGAVAVQVCHQTVIYTCASLSCPGGQGGSWNSRPSGRRRMPPRGSVGVVQFEYIQVPYMQSIVFFKSTCLFFNIILYKNVPCRWNRILVVKYIYKPLELYTIIIF